MYNQLLIPYQITKSHKIIDKTLKVNAIILL